MTRQVSLRRAPANPILHITKDENEKYQCDDSAEQRQRQAEEHAYEPERLFSGRRARLVFRIDHVVVRAPPSADETG